jgi:MYXO-CTERM domain-containing protein
VAGLAAGSATLLLGAQAEAYCRTSTCPSGSAGEVCVPAASGDCGTPLYWAQPCFGFAVQQNASRQVPWDTADGIAQQAFATWVTTACGAGGRPNMQVVDFGPIECSARQYNQSGGNANVIVFRDDGWPYAGQWSTLALTTVTYNLDTGEIYDADMEVNASDVTLTTGDTNVQFDLLSIVTHEAGHMLGLAHSQVPDTTMGRQYQSGETTMRSLTADDVAAICAVYPPVPTGELPSCDPTPRHGFTSACGPFPPEDEGCSVARIAPDQAGSGSFVAALGVAIGAIRRRRRTQRP